MSIIMALSIAVLGTGGMIFIDRMITRNRKVYQLCMYMIDTIRSYPPDDRDWRVAEFETVSSDQMMSLRNAFKPVTIESFYADDSFLRPR